MVSHKVGGEGSSQMVLYRNLSIKMGSGRSINEDLDMVYLSVGLGYKYTTRYRFIHMTLSLCRIESLSGLLAYLILLLHLLHFIHHRPKVRRLHSSIPSIFFS